MSRRSPHHFLPPVTPLPASSPTNFPKPSDLYLQSLFEIGLVLFCVTILVNLLAQLVLKTFAGATVKQ